MPTDALFAAPLLVAAVLVASGVGKLRDPERAGLAFDALDVPPGLARPWMRTAHPWAELLLAVCLLATSGVASAVTAPYPHFPYHRQEAFARLNPPLV